ncbi:toprim domain-containing protein [Verminephrobacter aporrectodeae]|uniref:toprim domain-containing protein n=1 Tax=Verminephrobacter aporrectodeae TaxID=1110389 RepID=UPI002238AB44|nr:toprim domain-containing protein [Verminephrobacter aporrectodeae]
MDVISLAQHGLQNAVATLGTATSGQHVKRLFGLAQRVIFCFDGDDAGRRAAARALDVCLPQVTDATDVGFLFLPRDHDPDSYVRAKGGDAFCNLALKASTLEGFLLSSAMQGCQLEYAEGRARLVAMAAPRLQQIDNAPEMLRRILAAIAAPSELSVVELIDFCRLQKNML